MATEREGSAPIIGLAKRRRGGGEALHAGRRDTGLAAEMTRVDGWGSACDVRTPLETDAEERVAVPERNRPSGSPIRVECASGRTAAEHWAAWGDLTERSLERNVFLEPAFAVPLLAHAFGRPPDLLMAWDASDKLVGLLPVTLPGRRWLAKRRWPARPLWPGGRVARGLAHRQVAVGTPLLDAAQASAALSAMLDWLRAQSGAVALCLSEIPADGPFSVLVTGRNGATCHRLDERQRAALLSWPAEDVSVMPARASSRKRKELRRQHRRLSDLGRRAYTSARSPEAVASAVERFLVLERGGWKGDRGTALLASPALAAFVRSMTRSMAEAGKCRIDAIESDGQPVAMGIVLSVGGLAHFWKTTYDERHAALSPGVQFACELTHALRHAGGLTGIDSCAVPDHPMINRLWPDRIAIHDLLIDLRPDQPARCARVLRAERRRRRLRRGLKALVLRLRRWFVGQR